MSFFFCNFAVEMKDYTDAELAQILDKDIFHMISEAADSLGLECYVVGGYVRDIFLEKPSDDIDCVVVAPNGMPAPGIAVAKYLKKKLGKKASLSVFKNFGTAQVKVYGEKPLSPLPLKGEEPLAQEKSPFKGDSEGLEIEFVGARKESYQRDSRKPIVEDGTLEDDQNRRDFTINAMAICLNKNRFGELVDPFGGIDDLYAWGSVTGGGTYYYGDTIVISATANLGFEFLGWTDSNTDNPRTVVVTNNRTYTARFGIQQFLIKTDVTPEGAGTVNGGGTYNYGETIHLVAHSNPGYIFNSWDDGVIANPRSVFVEGNATYTAVFIPLTYEITTEADPAEGGTVTGGGTFNYGSTVTLTATANANYTFICWHDGIVRNPRKETVTGNANYKAIFHLNGTPQYTITVLANDPTLGTVTGSGTYPENTTIQIGATPNEGALFTGWTDGNTDNPRSITVTENMTFTAIFSEIETYTITVRPENPLQGSTYGGGTYPANTVINIGATASPGFHFAGWQDGDMNNPRTITVTQNAEYIASFSEIPVQTYTVTVYYDENQGFVMGAGTYTAGSTATLVAIPADGYYFVKWSDGVTEQRREILVDHDIQLAAFFNGTGIDENGFGNISLYPNPANDKLHIEGLEGEHEVQIYNAFGTLVRTTTLNGDSEIGIEALPSGLYFLHIEGHAMKFVKE